MCEQESFDEIFKTLHRFRQEIGFRINYDKTTVYRMGSLKDSNAVLYTQKNLNWTNIGVNVLGIYIYVMIQRKCCN